MPAVTDVNHPRILLIHWRDEADELQRMIDENPGMAAEARLLTGQINTLRRCADQLENRLLWSGLA